MITRNAFRPHGFTSPVHRPAFILIVGLLLSLPAFAGKGGNGKGNGNGGGDDTDLPPLMDPFVHYRVTWFEVPPELGSGPQLRDVNRDGIAVGNYVTLDNKFRAVVAEKDGTWEDLNDVFALALSDYPGWRFHVAHCINAAGQIAGTLVPNDEPRSGTSPDVLIVCGDLLTTPPSLTVVGRILDTGVWGIQDMNEAGDILVSDGSRDNHWLYRAPYADHLPETIRGPEGAEAFSVGYLNGAGQISMFAYFIERIYYGRKRYVEDWVHHVIVREPDGSLFDIGYGPGSWWASPISEDGVVYSPSTGSEPGDSPFGIIHRWDGIQGWQPITQTEGVLHAGVSKEAGNRGAVVIEGDVGLVHREGYGTYKIEVTSGLNGQADVDCYNNSNSSPDLNGISRREVMAEAGYICGGMSGVGFILTPVPIQP